MKFLAFASALTLFALTSAHQTHVTFWGAADAKFEMDVPLNGAWTPIGNPLSITYIQVADGPEAHCNAYGIDGSQTYVRNGHTVPVGPPQTQIGIKCNA